MNAQTFWIISLILGGMAGFLTWYSGVDGPPMIMGFEINSRPLTIAAAVVAAGLGLRLCAAVFRGIPDAPVSAAPGAADRSGRVQRALSQPYRAP